MLHFEGVWQIQQLVSIVLKMQTNQIDILAMIIDIDSERCLHTCSITSINAIDQVRYYIYKKCIIFSFLLVKTAIIYCGCSQYA